MYVLDAKLISCLFEPHYSSFILENMAIFAWTYRISNLGVDCVARVTGKQQKQNPTPCPHRQPLIQAFRYIGAINHPLSLCLYCSPCLFTPIFMTPLSPRCTCAHFLSTCSRLASRLATRLRLAPTWPPVARRPFQRGAWQGRVESRSPRPLLPLLFAMPGAPLDSSHFAQHTQCVPPLFPLQCTKLFTGRRRR